MSLKSYHHLAVNDIVTLDHYQWGPDGSFTVLESVEGTVTAVLKNRVVIKFKMRVWTRDTPWHEQRTITIRQQFSMQGGQWWGAENEGYCINARHSAKKVK